MSTLAERIQRLADNPEEIPTGTALSDLLNDVVSALGGPTQATPAALDRPEAMDPGAPFTVSAWDRRDIAAMTLDGFDLDETGLTEERLDFLSSKVDETELADRLTAAGSGYLYEIIEAHLDEALTR